MIRKFPEKTNIKMKIIMKAHDRNRPMIYEDCDMPENPFGLSGWVSFWVPPSGLIIDERETHTLVQIPLEQVDKIEMYSVKRIDTLINPIPNIRNIKK